MNVPPMTGPLRIETINGHPWVVGDGIACLCGDRAEAEALLGDLRLRLGNPLLDAVRAAFRELATRGWITQIERDTTGAVCRAFDMQPDAPGFAAVCHPLADDHVVIEVGEGVGDEQADLRATGVVAAALDAAGLTTEVELRDGAAVVTGRVRPGGTTVTARDAVRVPADVCEGLEAVRLSGLTNMLDRPAVARIAADMGYDACARWVHRNRELFARGVFCGFEVEGEDQR